MFVPRCQLLFCPRPPVFCPVPVVCLPPCVLKSGHRSCVARCPPQELRATRIWPPQMATSIITGSSWTRLLDRSSWTLTPLPRGRPKTDGSIGAQSSNELANVLGLFGWDSVLENPPLDSSFFRNACAKRAEWDVLLGVERCGEKRSLCADFCLQGLQKTLSILDSDLQLRHVLSESLGISGQGLPRPCQERLCVRNPILPLVGPGLGHGPFATPPADQQQQDPPPRQLELLFRASRLPPARRDRGVDRTFRLTFG